MDFNQAITTRRSIREYTNQEVTKKQIEKLIESAIIAPSWKNSQTARYHIITSDTLKEQFRESCLGAYNGTNCKNAPVIIVTTFVSNRSGFERDGTPSNELVHNEWGFYDLGLHNQNFLLAATNEGLSTLVMGIRDEAKIRQLLNIDENEIICSVIALGYSNASPTKPKRKEVESITTFYE